MTADPGRPGSGRRGPLSAVPTPAAPPPRLREVLGQFATGVTVVTAGGPAAHGMTANAFSSVSLDPPLVLVCVARSARMHTAITTVGSFGVSVLAADQLHLARWFADRRRPGGLAQFVTVRHRRGTQTGAPLLSGALAWLEADVVRSHAEGDHTIFVGRVVDFGRSDPTSALTFFSGGYHHVDPPAWHQALDSEVS